LTDILARQLLSRYLAI